MKIDRTTVEKTGDGGQYIIGSDIYEVTIKAVTVDTNDNGARNVGLFVEYNGNPQMLYGALPLDMFDGKPNESVIAAFQRLAVIAGLEDLEDPEEAVLPIGKGNADKEVMVLPGFEDVECKLWIKQEFYRKNDGSIGESRLVKDAFLPNNASADEIVNDTEIGVKYAKREKYFKDTKYGSTKSPLTEEEVQAWIDGGRKGGTSGGSTTSAQPKASFGKKSFGKN